MAHSFSCPCGVIPCEWFPNQACLWGPYFLFRNSLLVPGGRVPPESPGGSPAMIIQFPGPLLGCPKNTNPQKSPNSKTAVTSPDVEKSKSPQKSPNSNTAVTYPLFEKNGNPKKSPNSNTAVTSPDFEKVKIPKHRPTPTPLLHLRTLQKNEILKKIARLQHLCYISGL